MKSGARNNAGLSGETRSPGLLCRDYNPRMRPSRKTKDVQSPRPRLDDLAGQDRLKAELRRFILATRIPWSPGPLRERRGGSASATLVAGVADVGWMPTRPKSRRCPNYEDQSRMRLGFRIERGTMDFKGSSGGRREEQCDRCAAIFPLTRRTH